MSVDHFGHVAATLLPGLGFITIALAGYNAAWANSGSVSSPGPGGVATCAVYGNFDIIFGPFYVQFSAPRHLSRAVWRVLLGVHADRVLIGAWNPML